MVDAAKSSVAFLSYEQDPERAGAAQEVVGDRPNVEIVLGGALELFNRGPFDLLVHDGGPAAGKAPGSQPVDPALVLNAGGTMTVDDYTPMGSWPPTFEGRRDASRIHWLTHPGVAVDGDPGRARPGCRRVSLLPTS